MRNNEFMMALNALCADKDLSKEVVFDAIENALHAAYRRDFDSESDVRVTLDRSSGQARVYLDWKVVDEVEDPRYELTPEEAVSRFGQQVEAGQILHEERTPRDFGRIAAQTAKQVILQRLREAERDKQFSEFASREGELILGTVQSVDAKSGEVRLGLGRAEAILTRHEQIPHESYRVGQRVRAYVGEVSRGSRGPRILLSRTSKEFLRRLLELEVPEIVNGTVELRDISREAGARSKVAVSATQAGVDAVGACVGMKGTRIQSIVNELSGEKIDVVEWSPDEAQYVANALSPAKVIEAFLDPDHSEGKTAIVVVPDKQLSLAIGKEGQNARLAAKLTGWRIDIKSASEMTEERVQLAEREVRRREEEARRRAEEEERREAARALLAEAEAALEDQEDEEPLEAVAEVAVAEPPVAVVQPVEILQQPTAPVEEQAREAAQPQPEATPQPEPPSAPTPPARTAPPVSQPQPTPAKPPVRQPTPPPVYEDEEEEEEELPPVKDSSTMIFYTLNERGEAESLGDSLQRKRKNKKKGRRDSPDQEVRWDDSARGGRRSGGRGGRGRN